MGMITWAQSDHTWLDKKTKIQLSGSHKREGEEGKLMFVLPNRIY